MDLAIARRVKIWPFRFCQCLQWTHNVILLYRYGYYSGCDEIDTPGLLLEEYSLHHKTQSELSFVFDI